MIKCKLYHQNLKYAVIRIDCKFLDRWLLVHLIALQDKLFDIIFLGEEIRLPLYILTDKIYKYMYIKLTFECSNSSSYHKIIYI